MESNINTLAKSISGYIDTPDKYVYPFVIKEKNGKERTIIYQFCHLYKRKRTKPVRF